MVRVVTFIGALILAPTMASAQIFGGTIDAGAVQVTPGGIQPRDQTPKTGTSRLRGRVVAADTGQPLRKVMVRISSPEIREGRSTATSADGQFEFKDLPAGRYTVNAAKGGYVSLAYGQTRPFEGGRPVALGENQTIEKLDISLPRGSIITGRVVDEFGEPVADATVTPMRQQYVQGGRRMGPVGRNSTTNDMGEFRVFGLSPGQYFLTASLRGGGQPFYPNDNNDDRTGYAPTYYPGTADPAAAQRITLGLAQTVSDLQIQLALTPTARVSGVALDGSGRPRTGPGGMVMARLRRDGAFMMGPQSQSMLRPDGTFTISGITPGEYTITAFLPGDRGDGAMLTANVTVNGEDVTGVQLTSVAPALVSGHIVVDGATPTASASLSPQRIQIMFPPMQPGDGFGANYGPPATARDDLTFEAKAPPGRVRVQTMMMDANLSLKSVRYRGVDITDTGLDVMSGANITELEIELTARRQDISGLVTNQKGDPAPNYTVIVFPQDRERREGFSRYVATGRPDQEGRFRIRTLPPADYEAVALEYVEPGAWQDPDFLESLRNLTTLFSVGEGETKTLDLRLSNGR